MKDIDSRTHQMLVRSRDYMTQCIGDFVTSGAARQIHADLQAALADIEQHSAAHASSIGQARQGTRTRAEARDALQTDIEMIYQAARVMGMDGLFLRPALNNDENLLQAAGSYATNAVALKAQFMAHELPPDFLDALADDKTAFEAAISEQKNAVGDHISARREMEDALDRGVQAVRKFNGLVRVRYAHNPGKLAEWTAASHIERGPRSEKTPQPSPIPPPPPVSPTPAA